jgi:hypothetical protein
MSFKIREEVANSVSSEREQDERTCTQDRREETH